MSKVEQEVSEALSELAASKGFDITAKEFLMTGKVELWVDEGWSDRRSADVTRIWIRRQSWAHERVETGGRGSPGWQVIRVAGDYDIDWEEFAKDMLNAMGYTDIEMVEPYRDRAAG